LATSSSDVLFLWKKLKPLLKVIEQCTSLSVNAGKTQICLTCPSTFTENVSKFLDADGDLEADYIKPYLKYLGIFVGVNFEEARDLSYKGPLAKFVKVINFLSSVECGFTTTISLYSMLALSVFAYVGQFYSPPIAVLRKERWAIQVIQHSPYNALPSSMISGLTYCGLPSVPKDLAVSSLASMVRVGSSTGVAFRVSHSLKQDLQSEGVTIASMVSGLPVGSIIGAVTKAQENYEALIKGEYPKPHHISIYVQKFIYSRYFQRVSKVSFCAFLARRIIFFLDVDGLESYCEGILKIYTRIKVDPRLKSTHVKAICNAWCSNSRFGGEALACPFCCEPNFYANDRVAHAISCPSFVAAFCEFYGLDMFPFHGNFVKLLLTGNNFSLSNLGIKAVLFYIYLCFGCYNHSRHGISFDKRSFKFIVERSLRMSKSLRLLHSALFRAKHRDFFNV